MLTLLYFLFGIVFKFLLAFGLEHPVQDERSNSFNLVNICLTLDFSLYIFLPICKPILTFPSFDS